MDHLNQQGADDMRNTHTSGHLTVTGRDQPVDVEGGSVLVRDGGHVGIVSGGEVVAIGHSSIGAVTGGTVELRQAAAAEYVSGGHVLACDFAYVGTVTGGTITCQGAARIGAVPTETARAAEWAWDHCGCLHTLLAGHGITWADSDREGVWVAPVADPETGPIFERAAWSPMDIRGWRRLFGV